MLFIHINDALRNDDASNMGFENFNIVHDLFTDFILNINFMKFNYDE